VTIALSPFQIVLAIHVISMMSWVGAMYFNLVLLFPMYRSRGQSEYGELMMEQGTRAVYLLYLLVVLTLVSGVGLAWLTHAWVRAPFWLALKGGLWLLMLATHLVGTLRIWPKVFFALPAETNQLLFRYRCWMAVSASAGTIAIVLSILRRGTET
jgi:uncharacterized membrane protein